MLEEVQIVMANEPQAPVATQPVVEDGSEGVMVCNACAYKIESFDERTNHYRTEWHR